MQKNIHHVFTVRFTGIYYVCKKAWHYPMHRNVPVVYLFPTSPNYFQIKGWEGADFDNPDLVSSFPAKFGSRKSLRPGLVFFPPDSVYKYHWHSASSMILKAKEGEKEEQGGWC